MAAADLATVEGKLRTTVGAAMLLMRLMRQFLEVRASGWMLESLCVRVEEKDTPLTLD